MLLLLDKVRYHMFLLANHSDAYSTLSEPFSKLGHPILQIVNIDDLIS